MRGRHAVDHLGPEGGLKQKGNGMAPNHENGLPHMEGRFGRFATTYGLRIRAPHTLKKEDQTMAKTLQAHPDGDMAYLEADFFGREDFFMAFAGSDGNRLGILASRTEGENVERTGVFLNVEAQEALLATLQAAKKKRDAAIANDPFAVPL